MQLSGLVTFVSLASVLASEHNTNWTAVSNVINGNLGHDNFGTVVGNITWTVSDSTALCVTMSTSSTYGAQKITQTGVLAAAKSAFWVVSSAAQTTGDALVNIQQTSSSSTIPALRVETSVGEMLGVRKAGTTYRRPSLAKTSSGAPHTATATDGIIYVDASSASFTYNLPAVASSQGVVLEFVRVDQTLANAVTVDGYASETINGATTFKLCTQYERLKIHCDGSAWYILEHSYPSKLTAFTPTGVWTTNITYTGFWRRVGDCAEIHYKMAAAGLPNTAAAQTVNLPSGLTINTAKLLSASLDDTFGHGDILDYGTTSYRMFGRYSSTTAIALVVEGADVTWVSHQASVDRSTPITTGAGDSYVLKVMVPITNWEA